MRTGRAAAALLGAATLALPRLAADAVKNRFIAADIARTKKILSAA